jgi:hypothetical protein
MQNPFETGHIKNYILLYASVVLIMILFFIATTLYHDVKDVEKKAFAADSVEEPRVNKKADERAEEKSPTIKFRVLERAY